MSFNHVNPLQWHQAVAVSRQAPLDRQARFCAALSLLELQRYNDAFSLLQALHGDAARGG